MCPICKSAQHLLSHETVLHAQMPCMEPEHGRKRDSVPGRNLSHSSGCVALAVSSARASFTPRRSCVSVLVLLLFRFASRFPPSFRTSALRASFLVAIGCHFQLALSIYKRR